MTRAIALALLAVVACKPESARRSDRAAKDLVEEREELVKAARELPDGDVVKGTKAVLEEAGDLARAADRFERQKSRRLAALQLSHDLAASQTGLISVLARDMPITDAARGEINGKLTRLQMRLDEATNLIEGLMRVQLDGWEARNTDVTDAMKRLEDARKDAWDALEDAPKTDRSES